MKKLLLALAILCCGPGAHAQTQDQKEVESRWSDSVVVIVHASPAVIAHARCPAMWKLSKGGANIWVLPTLLDGPRYGHWDSSCFKKRLKQADALFIQDKAESLPAEYSHLPPGTTLKDAVSDATYRRFVETARRVHDNPALYDRLDPVWAAYPLVSHAYNLKHIVPGGNYPDDLADLAREARVRVYALRRQDMDLGRRNIRSQVEVDRREACLNANLDRVDYTLNVLPGLLAAWQSSDIATVLRDYPREDDRCSPRGETFFTVYGKLNIDNWMKALTGALDDGGDSVAAIPLPWLLYKDGVLDKMRASGVTVTPPEGLEDKAP